VVWSVIDPSRAVWVAVSVLIVTCPCALSLAAPAALVAAAGGLARRGVIFKRLEAIEALAVIEHLFVDKTGTLTEDRLVLRHVHALPAIDAARSRGVAASLAAWSQHPLSRALAEAGDAVEVPWQDVREEAGQGLQARDDQGRCWQLGSWAWVGQGQADPAPEARVWLACDGAVQAGFVFDEAVREGALDALQALKAQGLHLTLLSGDDPARAAAMAQRLGLDEAIGRASPEDKLARVQAAQAAGRKVGMVGDGINDAPVLARADVSLAMGQGALVARTQADAVIVSNRLADLVRARVVSVRTMRHRASEPCMGRGLQRPCIPLALAGWLPPWAAGLGMAGEFAARDRQCTAGVALMARIRWTSCSC
jgi:Cu2+-exporting ATPase